MPSLQPFDRLNILQGQLFQLLPEKIDLMQNLQERDNCLKVLNSLVKLWERRKKGK